MSLFSEKLKQRVEVLKFTLPEYTNSKDAKIYVNRLCENNLNKNVAWTSKKQTFLYDYWEIDSISLISKDKVNGTNTWEVAVTLFQTTLETRRY